MLLVTWCIIIDLIELTQHAWVIFHFFFKLDCTAWYLCNSQYMLLSWESIRGPQAHLNILQQLPNDVINSYTTILCQYSSSSLSVLDDLDFSLFWWVFLNIFSWFHHIPFANRTEQLLPFLWIEFVCFLDASFPKRNIHFNLTNLIELRAVFDHFPGSYLLWSFGRRQHVGKCLLETGRFLRKASSCQRLKC